MHATKETTLEVAIRSELLSLQRSTSRQTASASARREVWRKRATEQAEQVAEAKHDQEERLLKLKLEETWSLTEHPKKDQIWFIAKDLGYHQGLGYIEEVYCRLMPLILPNP